MKTKRIFTFKAFALRVAATGIDFVVRFKRFSKFNQELDASSRCRTVSLSLPLFTRLARRPLGKRIALRSRMDIPADSHATRF